MAMFFPLNQPMSWPMQQEKEECQSGGKPAFTSPEKTLKWDKSVKFKGY